MTDLHCLLAASGHEVLLYDEQSEQFVIRVSDGGEIKIVDSGDVPSLTGSKSGNKAVAGAFLRSLLPVEAYHQLKQALGVPTADAERSGEKILSEKTDREILNLGKDLAASKDIAGAMNCALELINRVNKGEMK